MNKIVNDVEYYTFSIMIPIYKIKPPINFQKYYQTHKDEIIVDLQKKNKTLKQDLQRKDNIINELKNGIKELDNMFYETFRISQDGYFSISEWELKNFTDKIKELEGKNE